MRREAVRALGPQPLPVLALEVAGGDVVEDRVAEDVVQRLVPPIPLDAPPADDHRQLALEVELLGGPRPRDRRRPGR